MPSLLSRPTYLTPRDSSYFDASPGSPCISASLGAPGNTDLLVSDPYILGECTFNHPAAKMRPLLHIRKYYYRGIGGVLEWWYGLFAKKSDLVSVERQQKEMVTIYLVEYEREVKENKTWIVWGPRRVP